MKEYVWFYQFPIGEIGIAEDGQGISSIFLKQTAGISRLEGFERKETKRIQRAAKELDEYFRGMRREFEVEIHPSGTAFQKQIWEVLRSIPYGETRSYEEVAILADNPKACRAVGMANNKNPIMLMIPCHRVIGKNGSLTGYAGGLNIKDQLLELERDKR